MTRKFTQFAVFALAILTAELLQTYAHHFFAEKFIHGSPYKKVALSMAVTILVFYPAFQLIEKYIHSASEKYVEGAKSVTRNRLIGLVLGFIVALFILFCGFSQIENHKNPLSDLKKTLK